MGKEIDWSEWTALPTTNNDDEGIEEFRNMQFAYPSRKTDFTTWTDLTIETHFNQMAKTISFVGYHQGDEFDLDDRAIYRSGPELEWDFIIDNIPVGNNFTNAVEVYTVDYPDSHATGEPADQLVVKAIRNEIQFNRKIGILSRYGTYVTVTFAIYRRRFTGTSSTDTRLDGSIVSCQIYKDNEVDVGAVETRLEFFYIDYAMLWRLAKQLGIDVTTPEGEAEFEAYNFQLGDFFLGMSSTAYVTGDVTYYTSYRLWAPEKAVFSTHISGLPNCESANPAYGIGADKGGYNDADPTHDFHSDDIVHSGAPQLSALSSGFVNAYKVTSGLLTDLGKALFPQKLLSMDATGLNDAQVILKSFRYLIDNQHNKGALDFIIDCHIVPVNVPTSGTRNISAGGTVLYNPNPDHPDDPTQGTPYPAPVVSGLYVSKSCGSITTPEAFGNFLDYTVRCKLYLPFYGYVDIPPEYWNGGTLSVEYMFNIFDGTFVAFVNGKSKHSNLNSLIGQYSGVACTHIPISSRDYSQIISGIVSLGIGVAGTVAGGEIAGQLAYRTAVTTATMGKTFETAKEAKEAHDLGRGLGDMARSNARITTAGQAVSQAASGLSNVLSMKPSMCNNGTSNSSSAMMMHKKPYLIIEYPTPQFSIGYPDESGLPLNVFAPLGSYGGMTIAENPVLDGIPCTAEEKDRIRMGLASGLIFR